ncbi:hypothetical protein Bca101_022692 [Brassica carinata]
MYALQEDVDSLFESWLPLEINKVVVQTFEYVKSKEKLKAANAIFYFSFRNLNAPPHVLKEETGSGLVVTDSPIWLTSLKRFRFSNLVNISVTMLWLHGDECFLFIGNNNEIREFCSIHRSSTSSDKTVIGDNNLIMGSCHIAHDCKIGDRNIFANNTLLAGHVIVQMKSLRAAYRKIFMSTETVPLSLEERLTKMEHNQELCSVAAVGAMLQSIRDSFTEGRRGICKFRQWLDS